MGKDDQKAIGEERQDGASTNLATKQAVAAVLEARIVGARTGSFLGVSFAEIAQQTGTLPDALETLLRDMCHHDGVIRVGGKEFRQDNFTLDKLHRAPDPP